MKPKATTHKVIIIQENTSSGNRVMRVYEDMKRYHIVGRLFEEIKNLKRTKILMLLINPNL